MARLDPRNPSGAMREVEDTKLENRHAEALKQNTASTPNYSLLEREQPSRSLSIPPLMQLHRLLMEAEGSSAEDARTL